MGVAGWGKSLGPRHFLDEFRPISGFQKGLLTRKTSHRQPHSFLLVQREELLYDFGGMRQDLVHCSGPILEIYKALPQPLSETKERANSCLVKAAERDVGVVDGLTSDHLVMCPFQVPPSRFRAFLPTEFTKARDSSNSRLKVPEAKKTHVRQNRSSQKPSIEILKQIKRSNFFEC